MLSTAPPLTGLGAGATRRTDWNNLYRELQARGSVYNGDEADAVFVDKKNGMIGIEFPVGGFMNDAVDLQWNSRPMTPANGRQGTIIRRPGADIAKKVYFFDLSSPLVLTGEYHLTFERTRGRQTDGKAITVFVGRVDAQG